MEILYGFGLRLYAVIIWIISPFHSKAKKWMVGRQLLLTKLSDNFKPTGPVIWFHAASLGEFEQGRPLMEAFRKEHPEYYILLTFFSPSGYEIRKNYTGADYICYLPLDTKPRVRKFLRIVNPEITVFIKYEYWYNFLTELKNHTSKLYLISAIFRADQPFFKPYGKWFRKMLQSFDHLFVQDKESKELLHKINIDNVTVTGDTRYDRVVQIVNEAQNNSLAEVFSKNRFTYVFGSTWEKDEDLLTQYINNSFPDEAFILAPHEIDEKHLKNLQSKLSCNYQFYSKANPSTLGSTKVLIIDNIGLLASLYKYAKITYIGGGFGAGIHNILEAAVYGLPVVFGPNFQKFREARELIGSGGAFSISTADELNACFSQLRNQPEIYQSANSSTLKLVKDNLGATTTILLKIKDN